MTHFCAHALSYELVVQKDEKIRSSLYHKHVKMSVYTQYIWKVYKKGDSHS